MATQRLSNKERQLLIANKQIAEMTKVFIIITKDNFEMKKTIVI